MELAELQQLIDSQADLTYTMDDKGIVIRHDRFQTITHVTFAAVASNTAGAIMGSLAQGRDVDHITRVTGYFSRTSGWNKGKKAELADRHRTAVA